jgi:hypothetical protein
MFAGLSRTAYMIHLGVLGLGHSVLLVGDRARRRESVWYRLGRRLGLAIGWRGHARRLDCMTVTGPLGPGVGVGLCACERVAPGNPGLCLLACILVVGDPRCWRAVIAGRCPYRVDRGNYNSMGYLYILHVLAWGHFGMFIAI